MKELGPMGGMCWACPPRSANAGDDASCILEAIRTPLQKDRNMILAASEQGITEITKAGKCERLKSQNRVSTELEADWHSWWSCKQLHCL